MRENKKYTKEFVQEAVKNATCVSDALLKIGLINKGSNFKTLKRYIEKYEIDTSHFKTQWLRHRGLRDFSESIIIPLEKVLCENSTYSRTHLKRRLYNTGLKENQCELCGQGEQWQGHKMSLILDHINGIPDDNRLENLRIVCPNCNATLDTHCAKNKKTAL